MKRIGIMVAAVLGMLSFFEQHAKAHTAEVEGHEKTLEGARNEKGEITLAPDVLEHVQAQHANANGQLSMLTQIVDGLKASIDAATEEGPAPLTESQVQSIVSSAISNFSTNTLPSLVASQPQSRLDTFKGGELSTLITVEVQRQLAAAAANATAGGAGSQA